MFKIFGIQSEITDHKRSRDIHQPNQRSTGTDVRISILGHKMSYYAFLSYIQKLTH